MNAFVDAHRAVYGVEPIRKVLQVAPSTSYPHAARQTDPGRRSARALLDGRPREQIRRVGNDHFQVYGARKIWRQLRREGANAARCTVGRLMRRERVCEASCAASRSKPRSATRPRRARRIARIGNSRPIARTRCGHPISRMPLLGKASSASPSWLTFLPGASSAGRCRARPGPISCRTPWNKRCR